MIVREPYYDLVVLIPVFNDWESVVELLKQIDSLDFRCSSASFKVGVVLANDGGDDIQRQELPRLDFLSVHILTLIRNLGHQQAIAIGLAYIAERFRFTNLVIMDGDGEDLPSDILRLVDAQNHIERHVVFASRSERSEGAVFRFCYQCYKILFRTLTGTGISFGNFCVIPAAIVRRLAYVPEITIHFSAGVLKAKLPVATIPVRRGKRFSGNSKMNFVSLVIHGLSAFAVFLDFLSVRLMLGSLGIGLLAALGLAMVISVRCFTDLAIPGWATSAALGFAILSFQGLLSASVLGLMHLTQRTRRPLPAMLLYNDYVERFETVA